MKTSMIVFLSEDLANMHNNVIDVVNAISLEFGARNVDVSEDKVINILKLKFIPNVIERTDIMDICSKYNITPMFLIDQEHATVEKSSIDDCFTNDCAVFVKNIRKEN